MSSKNKLYVSFVPEDNAKDGQKSGWVDNFIHYLGVFLQRINGLTPEIVKLDTTGQDNHVNLTEFDGLVIINSHNYIKKSQSKKIISLLSDPSRIFKIDLTPIKKSVLPKELRAFNEFHFFETIKAKEITFVTSDISGSSHNFWLKIVDLAFDISRRVFHQTGFLEEGEIKTVYLTETSYDQINNRDEIKRELQRYGHTVLPAVPLSEDIKDFEAQVTECLEKADLTVHIVGEEYGESVGGSEKSVVELQNEIASRFFNSIRKENTALLERLIWMPLIVRPKTDQQKIYLDKLRDDISSTSGAEIIQTPLEILKTVIHTRLHLHEREKRAAIRKLEQKSDTKSIYLLYDKKDEHEIGAFLELLQNQKISVIMPPFEGKQIELLEKHRDSLIKSDGVLLYANKNLNWVNSKLNDMIKAPGFGKNAPFEAKAIYIKDASIPKEKIANFGDLIMLNGDGKGNGKTDLSPFIDKISLK